MLENNNPRMGIRDGLPIGIGYFAIAFAVGVFASSTGLGWFQALAISMLNFTSAGEIAAIPVIAAGGSLLEMALTQMVVNSRYALMSISFSQRLSESVRLRDRFLIAFFNGDEIFALVCAKDSLVGKKYIYALAILPYIGWCVGTLLGALIGDILPPFLAEALSIGLYAMLITIITQATKNSRSTLVCVLVAIAVSCLCTYLPLFGNIPRGIVVVAISVIISAVFALVAPLSERDPWEEAENE